jgi:plasmid stability protein
VKTTLEIPDALFRRAKLRAAERGQTIEELVTEALQEKLAARTGQAVSAEPEWMQGFGKLRRLRKETKRIQARIDEVFEVIEHEQLVVQPD